MDIGGGGGGVVSEFSVAWGKRGEAGQGYTYLVHRFELTSISIIKNYVCSRS